MTSVPGKSEAWVASNLPQVYRAPGKGLLDTNIGDRGRSKTALWANQVLSDYTLKKAPMLLNEHVDFETFEALLKSVDIVPQTLRIATKYIESEGSTVTALHSQLVHPIWQLMEPEKVEDKKVHAANQSLTFRLREAASTMAYNTYIQLPAENWSSVNQRDVAGGVRTDLIFSVIFERKNHVTRGMRQRQDAVAREMVSEKPTTSKSMLTEAHEDKEIWEIELNLLPYEAKKLGQIDAEALMRIGAEKVKLGGVIPTRKYGGHVKGVRASLQQMLRYAVHYGTSYSALGDYRNNLLVLVPSTLYEDAKRYTRQAQPKKQDVQIDVSGSQETEAVKRGEEVSFDEEESKLDQEVVGNRKERTQPVKQPLASDKEISWMYADDQGARRLILFGAWLSVKNMADMWETLERDYNKKAKEVTEKQNRASHTPQVLTLEPQGGHGGTGGSRGAGK
ncbi:hypothetical protein GLOTRDRAFT_97025 [Gloeophyllum trabeum ATCC 11539]|uniref:Uncharacterized protein n=1 Tax=Gloeophyllum trabeum (strain ATCC 11539 / FP-39264 / Madison 617) TaxID=670483 RepID=S7PSP8_GLOTA|nr:uncharacterized protein GLOTRDRAFT_97025 [Gloeophyllum trabeum ATCC 11539]EPQ50407.1 hypothetical protein GLOTRDRAFT_97025 [Gloeophyllum trabeum ATCC 11539]